MLFAKLEANLPEKKIYKAPRTRYVKARTAGNLNSFSGEGSLLLAHWRSNSGFNIESHHDVRPFVANRLTTSPGQISDYPKSYTDNRRWCKYIPEIVWFWYEKGIKDISPLFVHKRQFSPSIAAVPRPGSHKLHYCCVYAYYITNMKRIHKNLHHKKTLGRRLATTKISQIKDRKVCNRKRQRLFFYTC